MQKKAEIPYWLVMLVYVLLGLLVVLIIYGLMSGKLKEFLGWLESMI